MPIIAAQEKEAGGSLVQGLLELCSQVPVSKQRKEQINKLLLLVTQACNFSNQEGEAGEFLCIQGQFRLLLSFQTSSGYSLKPCFKPKAKQSRTCEKAHQFKCFRSVDTYQNARWA